MIDDAIIVFFRFNYLRKISSVRWQENQKKTKSNFLLDTLEATSFKFTTLLPPVLINTLCSGVQCLQRRSTFPAKPSPSPGERGKEGMRSDAQNPRLIPK